MAVANQPTNGKVKLYAELANRQLQGGPGLSNLLAQDRLEFLPQLRGRKAAELYREMATNDAIVGAILFEIEMVLRRVGWEVEPGTSGEDGEVQEVDVERADFLNSCMLDLSSSWEEVVKNALTMLPFGFAALEVVYKQRLNADLGSPAEKRTQFPDGRIGWRKFSLIPAATVSEFVTDETGGVQSICQGGQYGMQRIDVPIEKALLFRTDTSNPRGTSILRKVVESWYYRKRFREIEAVGAERDLAGLPKFTVDADVLANPTRRAEYEKMVRNIRVDEQMGVVLPGMIDAESGKMVPLAELELLSSGGTKSFDTDKIINRYNREIAMAVLQDVILLGHEKVGTQALASEKRDLSDTALQAWLNDIASVFNNHAVPRLFALNGESLENLPKLCPGELRATDVTEFAEAIKNVAGAGFMLAGDPEVEQEVRRRVGLPPMSADMVQDMQAMEPMKPMGPEPSNVGPPAGEDMPADGDTPPAHG